MGSTTDLEGGDPLVQRGARSLRDVLRNTMVGIAVVVTSPLWLPARVFLKFGGEGAFVSCGQLLSLIPGLAGVMLRRGYYLMCLDCIALDCGIGFGTWFAHTEVRIDPGVSIGPYCTIGMCHVGSNTLIGSNVDILSGRRQHHFDDSAGNLADQGGLFTCTRIGSNCWIGNSTVIMADVGDHCVVGAGAVVVKPIPSGSVAVGNPAVCKKPLSSSVTVDHPSCS